MKPITQNSAILRGAVIVAAAMLTPIAPALAMPNVDWRAVALGCVISGLIALRGYIDQSLSQTDNSANSNSANSDQAVAN